MREKILQLFQTKESYSFEQIKQSLHCSSSKEFTELIQTLNLLEDQRVLYNDHQRYHRIEGHFFCGRIKSITRSDIHLFNEESTLSIPKPFHAIYFVGDEVLVSLKKNKIIHTYKRNKTTITGYMIRRRNRYVFHSNTDYHCSFFVKNQFTFPWKKNDVLLARIVRYKDPVEIELIESIGKKDDIGIDITSLLYERNIRMDFNQRVKEQVKSIPVQVQKEDRANRIDHRDLFTVTIDGEDAKDFDDAISVEKDKNGYILYVHIADVTHYVRERSLLDKEAFLRSTSIYVCDRVVPMLPFALSNGICSLNPKVDRCTITCKMYIDSKGKCTGYRIYPSLIHSDRRCTYTLVNQLYDHPELSHPYDSNREWFSLLRSCVSLLMKQSKKRGKIDFESREPNIDVDANGKVRSVSIKDRGISQEMIEECMILANTCVAHELNQKKVPGMYRIHTKPDSQKMEDVYSLCTLFHVPPQQDMEKKPKQIQRFLDSVQDPEIKTLLSSVLLRSMQKAQYKEQCLGHFGLNLEEYCHFTSPIRRYSDVVIHRMLKKYIFTKREVDPKDQERIAHQSIHVSEKEREAVEIERKINAVKMAEYMSDYIGKSFEGTIISVMEFGCFVTLENGIEGLIPIRSLDDFYVYNPATYSLSSAHGKRIFQIGQKVKVICTQVNIEKGQVEFRVSE